MSMARLALCQVEFELERRVEKELGCAYARRHDHGAGPGHQEYQGGGCVNAVI